MGNDGTSQFDGCVETGLGGHGFCEMRNVDIALALDICCFSKAGHGCVRSD